VCWNEPVRTQVRLSQGTTTEPEDIAMHTFKFNAIIVTALAAGLFCACGALAQAATGQSSSSNAKPSFSQLDKNHDHKLSRSEIPKDVPALRGLRTHFADYDADRDNKLSPPEYAQYAAPLPDRLKR
jgi:hypothetical protein